ncbi:poly(U)-specific endoribonuclease homolog isoform X2 [Bombus bifarius]|uniref:Poly(U)-specific endoribonuclease homolog isoform X2 n=1 Tax=Bombus bifarius TaxID=103933 RepID=A0A6P8M9F9_9HYME|nr:poly(U)-specific endoribonuclease homolog isoform X2 [Bombus vancouverensis nearcticus]XP_033299250.1 poly(U)-specific endoribonuclease homolog isoform X2 [Bombus bifarius]
MNIKSVPAVFLILGLSLIIIGDAEAGWKFWKKKDATTTTTTVAPAVADPVQTKPNTLPGATPVTNKPTGSPTNVGSAVLGAGDPGLAIGVTSTGGKIKENARPSRPNPGTEVGLDFPAPKPGNPGVGGNTGKGYRDWAVDLTGAGEPGRQSPKLPSEGPALSSGGSKPNSVPGGTAQPQTPGSPTPGSKPAVAPGQPQPSPNQPAPGGNQVSSLFVTLKPGPTPAPSRPGSPGSLNAPGRPGSPNAPGSPGSFNAPGGPGSLNAPGSPGSPNAPGSPGSPGRTWADVAGGGSRSNSPTPAPRPGYPNQPNYPSQPGIGQSQPRPSTPTQPGRTGPSTGAIAGGALAGGALAGAAVAGAAAANKKTYSSNPTFSKGNTITDEDLEKLSEALFIKDNNNANRYITLNLQKQTSSSSTTDDAPQPLFTVNAEAYQGPTIQRVISIYDNYKPETNVNEHISPLQRQEESLLVDTFLSTNVMSYAMRFLADKGQIRKDYYEYKDTIRKIWFNLFSRGQGKIGSSGFEHVFMAELKSVPSGTEVVGLHNWIFYSKEESSGKANYAGYLNKVDLGDKASIIKIRTKYNGYDKPVTALFVGTSPELEMALYTVCFYARPEGNCPVSLGGTKFNIVTYKFKYRGNDLVGTAYPDI